MYRRPPPLRQSASQALKSLENEIEAALQFLPLQSEFLAGKGVQLLQFRDDELVE